MYETIKFIHLTTVAISILGFLLRGFWMFTSSPLLQIKPVKILPHINDTILLISAIYLAVLISASPMEQSWLMAKILGLFVYIGLGVVALKRGKTMMIRATAFVLAVLVFVYIAMVAVSKTPLF